jgi:hypothetical protein
VRRGLPNRDYAYKFYALPVTAMSLSRLALEPTKVRSSQTNTAAQPGVAVTDGYVYQFTEAKLRRDHCSVENLAVQLYRNGDFVVSLRADQNPLVTSPIDSMANVTTKEPIEKFTAHLLRNQFVVRVRCYGKTIAQTGDAPLGKPVIAEFEVPPFWVERGEPKHVRQGGNSEQVRGGFDHIETVELEFTYRLADYEKGT